MIKFGLIVTVHKGKKSCSHLGFFKITEYQRKTCLVYICLLYPIFLPCIIRDWNDTLLTNIFGTVPLEET